ncbi:hypothetical protein GCM10023331_17790 [Algivirga pacifica]|uniref:Beta-lactamase-related domain-containing protein n=2 Tax=Algivirga pacifica TaxID=1162670 RepID=A0ABP9D9J9_9BACT
MGLSNLLFAQDFETYLAGIAQKHQLVGMSAIVVHDGQMVESLHFGKADIERNIPIGKKTMYRIASISKLVTATALMKLYEEGSLDLDKDVSEYLGYQFRHPNHPNAPITAKMLLAHTSGLRDGKGYFDFLKASYGSTPKNISGLLTIEGSYHTSDLWGTEIPGKYFTYANINYGVIGTLIEKISGKRFDLYVKEVILDPLGMDGSFNVSDIANIEDMAVLYRKGIPQADNYGGVSPSRNMDHYIVGSNGLAFAPQGGLRTSAESLGKFMQMHINYGKVEGKQVFDSTTIAKIHEPVWTYSSTGNGNNYHELFNQWGCGAHLITNKPNGDIVIDNLKMVGHPGEAYGLISDMYFNTEHRFGVIFITNGYYRDKGYSYGQRSAFYGPEEETFMAVEQYYYPLISALNQETQEKETFYVSQKDKQVHFTDTPKGTLLIYSLQGKLLRQVTVNSKRISLKEQGACILVHQTEGKVSAVRKVTL